MTGAARHPEPVSILVGAALMMSLAMGMRQSLGLFLPPVTHDLGLTAADFTFAVAIQNVMWGVFQAPAGAIADKWGLRPVMLSGCGLYCVGMLIMLRATGFAGLAISGAFVGVAMACTASSLAMTAAARAASPQRRSVVLGMVGACASLGTLLIAPSVQTLLAGWHWHAGALFFLALAVAMVPASLAAGAVDRLPRAEEQRGSMKQALGIALSNRRYLVMSGAYFVCGLQLIFLTTHLPNYLAICGQDPMLGASALATIGGMNIFGSLLAGWLGARFPKYILLGLLYLIRSLVLALYFIMPPTPVTTIAFAAAIGMLWLAVVPLVSGLVAELFGTRFMTTILGISFVVHQMGSVLGAWGGGLIFDITGRYDRAWQIGVLVGAAAGLAQIVLGGPAAPWSGRFVGARYAHSRP